MCVPLSLCRQVWVLTCYRVLVEVRGTSFLLALTFHIAAMLSLFSSTRLAVPQSSGESPVSVSCVTIGTLGLWMCSTISVLFRSVNSISCPHDLGALPTESSPVP